MKKGEWKIWRVFHRQVEFFCVMVSDCKNLLAILFVARALNQSKSNWFNFLICKKNVLCTEHRTLLSPFFCSLTRLFSVLFCSPHTTPSHFLPYTTLPGTDIIFPFHSNNLSFSIFRLLDLTFLLLFTWRIRVLYTSNSTFRSFVFHSASDSIGVAMLLCSLTQQLIRIALHGMASHRYVCTVVLHFAIF